MRCSDTRLSGNGAALVPTLHIITKRVVMVMHSIHQHHSLPLHHCHLATLAQTLLTRESSLTVHSPAARQRHDSEKPRGCPQSRIDGIQGFGTLETGRRHSAIVASMPLRKTPHPPITM
ncbi:hypothetical protein M378DRAFT_173245 [Amanita muscaria Koide BX008]|uniref:Uncharacterized protein n=1 Tax=Amanita muscaria (strain Koide BX008) TaxID=946122 RepID=A0A0C2RZM6_AMAMK|nr:hypothetical protein M378DRAFT_173245 [Amanita muscaria Koide BX008]